MKKQLSITALTCSALLAFTEPVKAQESTYNAWVDFESSWFPKSLTIACAKLLGDNEYGYYFRISKKLGNIINIEELENNEWTNRKLVKSTDASVSFSEVSPQRLSKYDFDGLNLSKDMIIMNEGIRVITLNFIKSKMYSTFTPESTIINFIKNPFIDLDNPFIDLDTKEVNPFDKFGWNTKKKYKTKVYDFGCYIIG